MLTDLRSILALAEEKGCAIPAFNCYTQECVMGVLEAAKETGAPVIFQMFSRLADTNDGNFVAPAILEAIRQLPQPAGAPGGTARRPSGTVRPGSPGAKGGTDP